MTAFNQEKIFYNWSYAWGKPTVCGVIKSLPEHFLVSEQLRFEPEGSGEHVYLFVEKRDTNTDWVADKLAEVSGVAKRDVSYAGMKDRRAVTRQWYSVYLAAKSDPNWNAFESEQIKILKATRHQRKLRRGALDGNRFEVTIADLDGDAEQLIARLDVIKNKGVPNYFGEQRFGRDGKNIECAIAMFAGKRVKRNQRSIYLSAARSFIFNELLSQRIQNNNWQQVLAGDVLMLSGTHSVFAAETDQLEELQQRLDSHDLDTTGPLAGDGELMTTGNIASLEQTVFDQQPKLIKGLKAARMESARRALRVVPKELQWEFSERTLKLKFFLPAGSYATSVLRELVDYTAK
ncbi:MAG: tRNA pseudouridine(13) synthase TruD [Gammaproteobacteria bacterium]|nr:tRNA pseudouridine(13) synthase TruD [Gammaproteobacteria bacterium]